MNRVRRWATNIFEYFQKRVSDRLDSAALIDGAGSATWSYRQLFARAASWHGRLAEAGLRPSDRVLVRASKSFDGIALYLGVLRAGGVYVPVNPECTAAEWRFLCEDAAPSVVVWEPSAAEGFASPVAPTLTLRGGSDLARERAELGENLERSVVERTPEDLAAMIYTSGTTGKPKGALLPHRALISNADALVHAWEMRAGDVLIHALPIFHVHGLFVALHTLFAVGGCVRLLERFDTGLVRALLPQSTVLMGVPTFYVRLMDATSERGEWGGMRLVTSGSAPLTAELHRAFLQQTGIEILERYGMTEAGMLTSNPYRGERRAGSVGFALDGIELRLAADSEGKANGSESERVGELEARGPNLCVGYWNRPEASRELFTADGFLKTGDLAAIDSSGRVTLVGRRKDLIISGGMNVYPKEIEECIESAGGVREVAVIGLADAQWGESVAAVVVFEDLAGEDGPANAARLRLLQERVDVQLASYKRPKRWIVARELPRNALGKIQKKQLREVYAASSDGD